jgi:hypothetical protein
LKKIFLFFFKKGVDKPGFMWYNISVRKRGQRNDNL